MPQGLVKLLSKLVYALLCGVVTFGVIWIIGAAVGHFEANIGSKIEDLSGIIGVLVGIYVFLTQDGFPSFRG